MKAPRQKPNKNRTKPVVLAVGPTKEGDYEMRVDGKKPAERNAKYATVRPYFSFAFDLRVLKRVRKNCTRMLHIEF